MSRPALLVPALVSSVLLAAPTHAAPPPRVAAPSFELLDADASLVLSIRPRAVWTLVAWLESFGGTSKPFIAGAIAEASSSLTRELGVDPLHEASWVAAGLDPGRPIVAGLASIDHKAARRAFDAIAKNPKAKIATPYWRSRFVIPTVDAAAFKKALSAAAQGPEWALVEGPPEALATVLGLDAKAAAGARTRLAAQRVLAVWRPGEDTLGFLRAGDGIVLGDVLSPFARKTLDLKALPALLAAAVRAPGRGGVAARLTTAAGTSIMAADLGMWTTPDRVLDLGQTLGRQQLLGVLFSESGLKPNELKALVAQGQSEVERCDHLRPLPASLGVVDGAWTVDVRPKSITTRAITALAATSPLPAALPAADDGLIDLKTSAEAPAVAIFYGAGLKGLLAAARPVTRRGQPPLDLARSIAECGSAGLLAMGAFAWPYGVAAVVDEAPTEVKPVILGARNFAVAWKTFASDLAANVGVITATFDAGLATAISGLATGLGGTRGTRKVGARNVDTWARTGEPLSFVTQPTTTVAAGVAFGGAKALDWFWGRPATQGSTGAPPALGALRADVPAILRQLAPAVDAAARPMLDDVSKRLGTLAGTIKIAPAALTVELGLELR